MDVKKTGALISALRKEKGITQKELAEKLHVSDRTISKWERAAGFPDVALLEPLADELGITVRELLSGEREDDAAVVRSDRAVRDAVKFVYEQCRQKTRKHLRVILCAGAMAVFFGFLFFAVLDCMGAFLREISYEVPAVIYQNGEEIGQTAVVIDGEIKVVGTRNFFGTFYVPEAPVTGREQVSGYIQWDQPADGWQEIMYSRPGQLGIDAGLQRYLYISPDMHHFAVTLGDGRIIATNDALAKLQAIPNERYALDYDVMGYPYGGYYIAEEND